MSTLTKSDIYMSQGIRTTPTAMETASAGGPAPESGKLPLVAWGAFVILLIVIRMLWEYSE